MFNPATKPNTELNDFTSVVKQFSRYRTDEQDWRSYWVQLRNGDLVRPTYKPAEDETCVNMFVSPNGKYQWNLDGTSINSTTYDMMELVCDEY